MYRLIYSRYIKASHCCYIRKSLIMKEIIDQALNSISHYRNLNALERINYLLSSTAGIVCQVALPAIFYYSMKQITAEIRTSRQNREVR